MPPTNIVPGLKVHVNRNGRRLAAVVVQTIPKMSLVWVKLGNEDPTVVDLRDLTLDGEIGKEDDLSLWETEVFDSPQTSDSRGGLHTGLPRHLDRPPHQ
jgi:hypothetical protein